MSRWERGDYVITTDANLLDIEFIHSFLANESYWARGRDREKVERSLQHSLNFGVFKGNEQVGFARVVSDYATFAWLADVFVIQTHRGHGLSKWLLEVITTHPQLRGLRRWILATKDAHELYRKFGFTEPPHPERLMERLDQ
jgi:GNAT superfamily N-acetyltransferase